MGVYIASDFYKLEENVIRFYEKKTGFDWMEDIVTPMATSIAYLNGLTINEVAERVTYHFDAQNYCFQMLLTVPMGTNESVGEFYLRKKAWRHTGKARLELKGVLDNPSYIWEVLSKSEDEVFLKRVGVDMPPLLVFVPFGLFIRLEDTQYFIGKVLTPITKGKPVHFLYPGGLPLTLSMVDTIKNQIKAVGGHFSEPEMQQHLLKLAFIQWGLAYCQFVDDLKLHI